MRLTLLSLLFAVCMVAGCGDDTNNIPLTEKQINARKAVRKSYQASDVLGAYHARLAANPSDPAQKQLLGLAASWTLELKAGGRFEMQIASLLKGSYSVTQDVLTLTVEKHGDRSLRELERMAREQGKDTAFIEKMRTFEFRILDNGRNLLAMKGETMEPGAFMFSRD